MRKHPLLRKHLLIVLAAAACGRKDKGGNLSAADKAELEGCIKTMEGVAAAEPADQARLFAEGCGEKLPGIAEYANAESAARMRLLAEKSDLVCPAGGAKVASTEGDKMRALVDACGVAHYGLAAGQEDLLSLDWFVVQRSAARAAELRGKATDDTSTAFGRAAAALAMPLPHLPAQVAERYTLPEATNRDAVAPRVYVIVGAQQTTAGAVPVARVLADGARMEFPGGDAFPGRAVADAELDQRVRALLKAAVPATATVEEEIVDEDEHRERIERARGEGILSAVADGGPRTDAPLLLADAAAPAVRLLAVARALEALDPRLAVASRVGGQLAGLTLGVGPSSESSDRPASTGGFGADSPGGIGTRQMPEEGKMGRAWAPLRLHLRAGQVWAVRGTSYTLLRYMDGRPDEQAIRALVKETRDLAAGRPLRLLVSAEAGPTVQELVVLLDAAAGEGVRWAAVVDPPQLPAADALDPGTAPPAAAPAPRPKPRVERKTSVPVVRMCGQPPQPLDNAVVDRYVRRQKSKINYCYEKSLLANPGLAGTVTVSFSVDAKGAVRQANASGVNPEVSSCVAEVIKGIQFPASRSGDATQTQRSFKFKPSGPAEP